MYNVYAYNYKNKLNPFNSTSYLSFTFIIIPYSNGSQKQTLKATTQIN